MKKTLFHKHWLFICFYWLLLGISIWAQMIKDFPLVPSIFQTLLFVTAAIIVAHIVSDILLPNALANGKMKLFVGQSLLMTLLLAFVLTIIPIWFYKHYVIGTNFDTPERIQTYGQSLFRLYSNLPSAILINATACGLRFYQEHSLMEKNHEQLLKVHLEAQLRILQDQINPHLMFNVLNHIHILMQKDTERASVLLIRFSDILRYQLYECNREFVTLEKELKYLKDLVAIEQIRWGEELEVKCNWNIQNGKSEISPLLLVPFIENAFKHVSRLPAQKGYVHLILKQSAGLLELEVENSNSAQHPRKKDSGGIGLTNVEKRLEILYPDRYELTIEKTESIYKVHLCLQLNPLNS
jgi:LytS/YehU family sensor histidine kinase